MSDQQEQAQEEPGGQPDESLEELWLTVVSVFESLMDEPELLEGRSLEDAQNLLVPDLALATSIPLGDIQSALGALLQRALPTLGDDPDSLGRFATALLIVFGSMDLEMISLTPRALNMLLRENRSAG